MPRTFKDIESFTAQVLAPMPTSIAKAQEHALRRVAMVISADARRKLGHYQEAVGTFPAWEPLAAATQAQRAREGHRPDDPLLRTGALRRSIKWSAGASHAFVFSHDPKARWHEDGTATIPPRPFMGPASHENRERAARIVGLAVTDAIAGRITIRGTPRAGGGDPQS